MFQRESIVVFLYLIFPGMLFSQNTSAVPEARPCYLELRESLLKTLDHSPTDAWAKNHLLGLRKFVIGKLADDSIDASDQAYLQGFLYIDEGKNREARNCLFRYLEIRRRSFSFLPDSQWREVEKHFSRLNSNLLTQTTVENREEEPVMAVVEPTPTPAPVRKKTATSRTQKPTPAISSDEILVKARRARTNGQLDVALRFYQLAKQVDPQSESIRKELADMEKEME
jgi:hypothetical protein